MKQPIIVRVLKSYSGSVTKTERQLVGKIDKLTPKQRAEIHAIALLAVYALGRRDASGLRK